MLLVPAVLKELKEEQRIERILYNEGTMETLPIIASQQI